MFLRTKDQPEDIQAGWAQLENLVSLRGRKFYGVFYPQTKEYRACVQTQEGDDAKSLGLEDGVLPGGRYMRERLRGEPPAVYDRIGPTFEAMLKTVKPDRGRPSIEFYRQRDEIDLLLPI